MQAVRTMEKATLRAEYVDVLLGAMQELAATDKGKMNFRGRMYATVATRVEMFRKAFGISASIETEIVQSDPQVVIMKSTIRDETGRIISTGYAEEFRSGKGVNSTSALENCETSAVGRALSALGLGGGEYASADELSGAITQQNARQQPHYQQQPQQIQQQPQHQPAPVQQRAQDKTQIYQEMADTIVADINQKRREEAERQAEYLRANPPKSYIKYEKPKVSYPRSMECGPTGEFYDDVPARLLRDQLQVITNELEKSGIDPAALCRVAGVNNINLILKDDFQRCLEWLRKTALKKMQATQ